MAQSGKHTDHTQAQACCSWLHTTKSRCGLCRLHEALYLLVVPQQSARIIIFHYSSETVSAVSAVSASAQASDAVLCSLESGKRRFSVMGTPHLVAWAWRAREMGYKHGYFYIGDPSSLSLKLKWAPVPQGPTFWKQALQAIPSPPVR